MRVNYRFVTSLAAMPIARCTSAIACLPPGEKQPYTLVQKVNEGNDTSILRFKLPKGRESLGDNPLLPTCISVEYEDGVDPVTGKNKVLKKSYSPISHPSKTDVFDLLVKSYTLRPGGGVGAYICGLEVGDSISASVKPERVMHGSPLLLKRWKHVGLIAGGTGIAPLYQIIKMLIANIDDTATSIHLLSINRFEQDILMKKELEQLVKQYPNRISVTYSLTGEKKTSFEYGRGDTNLALKSLPSPKDGDGSTMIFICGKDGFVETWGGPVGRAPPKSDGKKGPKIQGPLLGILKEAGYKESEVFKY